MDICTKRLHFQGDDVPKKSGKDYWRKPQLLEWLAKKNVEVPKNATVAELWDIINPMLDAAEVYNVEKILEKYGIIALRLPPYHPEFNPM